MAQHSQLPIRRPDEGRFWTDGWDAYPAARQRLFADIQHHRPANPVVIPGDVHVFYAAELKPDFARQVSANNPIIATEFCGTPVTSSAPSQSRTERYLAENPHIRYGRSDRRGFTLVELAPASTRVNFIGLKDVLRADSTASTLASFIVESGKPGLQGANF
jgi:alkaline phosphatase D